MKKRIVSLQTLLILLLFLWVPNAYMQHTIDLCIINYTQKKVTFQCQETIYFLNPKGMTTVENVLTTQPLTLHVRMLSVKVSTTKTIAPDKLSSLLPSRQIKKEGKDRVLIPNLISIEYNDEKKLHVDVQAYSLAHLDFAHKVLQTLEDYELCHCAKIQKITSEQLQNNMLRFQPFTTSKFCFICKADTKSEIGASWIQDATSTKEKNQYRLLYGPYSELKYFFPSHPILQEIQKNNPDLGKNSCYLLLIFKKPREKSGRTLA